MSKFGKSREISLPGVLITENCLLGNSSLMISILYLFQVIIAGDNFPLNISLNLSIRGHDGTCQQNDSISYAEI